MASPSEILDLAYQRAVENIKTSFIEDTSMADGVEYICRNLQNRAGVRLLMACLLAKVHRPEVDVRKPYTEIGDDDSFSGRTYDEQYLTAFIDKHELPCNPTTTFLTPAFRLTITFLLPPILLTPKSKIMRQACMTRQQALRLLFWIVLVFYAISYTYFVDYDWNFWRRIKNLYLPNQKVQLASHYKEAFLALRQAAESRE